MAKTWLAKIENGVPKMSPYNRADFHEWCKSNEGRQIRIEPVKKPVSRDMRGYYYAAVLPLIRSTCDEWHDLSSNQMHEVIKKLFFYFETWNPRTKRMERFGRSVMSDSEWNNSAKASEFLMILSQYLTDCGLEMPDPKEFIALRDGLKDDYPKIAYPKNDLKPLL